MPTLKFATRPSKLARWQTNHIAEMLQRAWPDLTYQEVVITTKGDRVIDRPLPEIGGKGLFTLELEQALLSGEVDAAVHSLKDLPTEDPPGLAIAAIHRRAPANDVLISPGGYTLAALPQGAVVGTSSVRRGAQVLAQRPDLVVKPLRGNVDTRVRKVLQGQYDAIVLAAAGVARLGLGEVVTQLLSFEVMLPAPGQGALAVQCRADDQEALNLLAAIDEKTSRLAVTAERAFLAALGGGCSLPLGAYATVVDGVIQMQTIILAENGKDPIRLKGEGQDPTKLGEQLAQEALAKGAEQVMYA